MYRDIPPTLRETVEPIVTAHGLELVDADHQRGPGGVLVRVIVDSAAGDGRVPVGVCAELSRELGIALDVTDGFSAGYRLEVSSPGLDRVLGREKDFAAAVGCELELATRRPVGGRRNFRGELLAFTGDVARLRVDGHDVDLAFEDIARARRIYHFGSADFGSKDRRAKRSRRAQRDAAAGEVS